MISYAPLHSAPLFIDSPICEITYSPTCEIIYSTICQIHYYSPHLLDLLLSQLSARLAFIGHHLIARIAVFRSLSA